MDNNETKVRHKIEIDERKETKITGVTKLESFNETSFSLETVAGYIEIKGSGMSLGKMDTENGVLVIKGTLDSLKYQKTKNTPESESFWKKLFR